MNARFLHFALALGFSCLTLGAQTASPSAPDMNQAQTETRHVPDPARQAKELAKKLNLTPDQQNQLAPILTDRSTQLQAIRADQSLTSKDRHAKMQSLRQDTEARIKSVLNDDQKQKYDELQQEAHQRMRERRQEKSNNPNN